jgi:hypothetical protein
VGAGGETGFLGVGFGGPARSLLEAVDEVALVCD